MLASAGLPGCIDCLYARPRWYMTTMPCALLSAVGFFALPAMQVLVLQDFKDMSGLAGGLSKLAMTLTSTGAAELVSFYFSDWGADRKGHYTHYHTQVHYACNLPLSASPCISLTSPSPATTPTTTAPLLASRFPPFPI